MSAGRALARWRLVHKWASLACTLFLLVMCVTGLPLVFRDELQHRSTAPSTEPPTEPPTEPHEARTSERRPSLSLEEAVRVAARHCAGETPQFLFWPEDRPDVVGVGLLAHPDDPGEEVHRVEVNLHDGKVEDEAAEAHWVEWILDLHRNLFLGFVGDLVLGAAALAFVLALISGLLVYRPFARRIDFGTVRHTSRRIAWLDMHNLIGIATVMWTGVVAVTGFLNTLEDPLFNAWQADRMPALMAHDEAPSSAGSRGSVDAAVATARQAAGDANPTSVTFPGTRFATPRHYLVWVHGDSPVTSRLFTPILVDGSTGALTSIEFLPWYLRMVELARPLHYGDYGGLPLKVLWALLDLLAIALLISGLYLWLPRNRAALEDAL